MNSESIAGILGAIVASIVLVVAIAYGPIGRSVLTVAGKLNRLQFLTIRRYLTLVFVALIVLLVVVAAWR